jgi:uncharacterized protein YuzE
MALEATSLAAGVVASSIRVDDDITIEFDRSGRLKGIDVLNASKRLRPSFDKLRMT